MPIYTKTGDKGLTSLFGGKRLSKSDARVETYGTVDELNSVLGIVIFNLPVKDTPLEEELHSIQQDLFEIGSNLANPQAKPLDFLPRRVLQFERIIDELTGVLPVLKNFILPGGSAAGGNLHFARTICRRAERRVVGLSQNAEVEQDILIYLNRLSDLLFTMARYVNYMMEEKETVWKTRLSPAVSERNQSLNGSKNVINLGEAG